MKYDTSRGFESNLKLESVNLSLCRANTGPSHNSFNDNRITAGSVTTYEVWLVSSVLCAWYLYAANSEATEVQSPGRMVKFVWLTVFIFGKELASEKLTDIEFIEYAYLVAVYVTFRKSIKITPDNH